MVNFFYEKKHKHILLEKIQSDEISDANRNFIKQGNWVSFECTMYYWKNNNAQLFQNLLDLTEFYYFKYQPVCYKDKLNQFLNNGNILDGDIIIRVKEGGEIKAHKKILCEVSEYFRTMFKLKSKLNEAQSNSIYIDDFETPTIEAMIMWTQYTDISSSLGTDLLKASDKYLIKDLKFECEQFLPNHINSEHMHHV